MKGKSKCNSMGLFKKDQHLEQLYPRCAGIRGFKLIASSHDVISSITVVEHRICQDTKEPFIVS